MNNLEMIYKIIVIFALIMLSGCYFTSHEFLKNNDPLVYEKRFFLNNKIAISLPTKGESVTDPQNRYWKIIYGKWLGFAVGDYPISSIHVICENYSLKQSNCLDTKNNKLPQENILYVSLTAEKTGEMIDKYRFMDLLFNNIKFRAYVNTSYDNKLLPDKILQRNREDEDDTIFNKILDSLIIEVDGRWVNPKILRVQPNDIVW